eukprot:TRINITY_DN41393_c0_g1_i1.p1 TRINITY_DN41393_c0_g1~~TRINITY_DN41393_c0_g1_i1.p1  ORF type:complete len:344 (-),score=92.59 TRINITY_DN41393_c0_g1_i1:256-1287(-)
MLRFGHRLAVPTCSALLFAENRFLRQSPVLKGHRGIVMSISFAALSKQNAESSGEIIGLFKEDEKFVAVSTRLRDEIVKRDDEDGEKLAQGIKLAVDAGLLPGEVTVEPTTKVNVQGKSPEQVCEEIVKVLGDAPSKGCVMTLQGLSGTGKGTTVAKLKETLPNSCTWSNGNVFRSLTLLAVTSAEQKGCELKDVLNQKDLTEMLGMLKFGKFNDKFDIKIEGLGCDYLVSEIQNSVLKESKFASKIPTVAEVTQGQVVKFVQGALQQMADAGQNVLVEGREQTLNHIRTPCRFELVLSDSTIIGMRQAALQLGAKAFDKLKDTPDADDAAVKAALTSCLGDM